MNVNKIVPWLCSPPIDESAGSSSSSAPAIDLGSKYDYQCGFINLMIKTTAAFVRSNYVRFTNPSPSIKAKMVSDYTTAVDENKCIMHKAGAIDEWYPDFEFMVTEFVPDLETLPSPPVGARRVDSLLGEDQTAHASPASGGSASGGSSAVRKTPIAQGGSTKASPHKAPPVKKPRGGEAEPDSSDDEAEEAEDGAGRGRRVRKPTELFDPSQNKKGLAPASKAVLTSSPAAPTAASPAMPPAAPTAASPKAASPTAAVVAAAAPPTAAAPKGKAKATKTAPTTPLAPAPAGKMPLISGKPTGKKPTWEDALAANPLPKAVHKPSQAQLMNVSTPNTAYQEAQQRSARALEANTTALSELLKMAHSPSASSPKAPSMSGAEGLALSPVDLLNMFSAQQEKISAAVAKEIKQDITQSLIEKYEKEVSDLSKQIEKLTMDNKKLVSDLVVANGNACQAAAVAQERENMIAAEKETARIWHAQAEAMR